MPNQASAVLYLDVEGGWGGSSRSLFYLVASLDRSVIEPVVLLRKAGPVEARYKALGISCHVVPELASFRPADRKNAVAFVLYLLRLRAYRQLVRKVEPMVQAHRIKMLHVNHESLACTGALLAQRFRLPWIGHVRTLLTPGWFARRVYRLMARRAAHVIFITEPNRTHFKALAGATFEHQRTSVVHNIIPIDEAPRASLTELEAPLGRFRVLSLTNFAPSRGVDRIVDVAAELHSRGDQRFAFYLCGQPSQTSVLTGRPDPYYAMIIDRVKALGLDDVVFFPGHVTEPERALATCDALIKLTRQANPWGRDIIEALSAGIPVLTLGSFQDFVEDGVNGFMDETFDAALMADHLVALASTDGLLEQMHVANRQKARALFHGPDRAREVTSIYAGVLFGAS